jgi:hypothetical protein
MSFQTFSARDFFMVVVKSKIKYTFYPPRFTFCKVRLMLVYFISLSIVNSDFRFYAVKIEDKIEIHNFFVLKIISPPPKFFFRRTLSIPGLL